MASFVEVLMNSFRMYPVFYDKSLKDYKNEKVKGEKVKRMAVSHEWFCLYTDW